MKLFNRINTLLAGGGLALALVALASTALAEDKKTDKPKPYPLDKCIVSDEKLGGDMGKFMGQYKCKRGTTKRTCRPQKSSDFIGVLWCPGGELNTRHCDFQSHALPTELPGHGLAG